MSQNLHGHWGSTPMHVLHEGQPVASLAACYAPPATTLPWLQQPQPQPPIFANYGVPIQQPHPFLQGGMYPPQPYYTAFYGQPVMMAGGVFGSRLSSGGGMVVAGHSQSLPSTPKNGGQHPARSMLSPTSAGNTSFKENRLAPFPSARASARAKTAAAPLPSPAAVASSSSSSSSSLSLARPKTSPAAAVAAASADPAGAAATPAAAASPAEKSSSKATAASAAAAPAPAAPAVVADSPSPTKVLDIGGEVSVPKFTLAEKATIKNFSAPPKPPLTVEIADAPGVGLKKSTNAAEAAVVHTLKQDVSAAAAAVVVAAAVPKDAASKASKNEEKGSREKEAEKEKEGVEGSQEKAAREKPTTVYDAMSVGDFESFETLLRKHPDRQNVLSKPADNPLVCQVARLEEAGEFMRAVMRVDAWSVTSQDEQYRGAMHIAANLGRIDVCRAMLEMKPERVKAAHLISQLDKRQMHALHYAVLSGNEELVELLVSLGGDRAAGIANGDGLYPLHMACSKGMAKAAAALCKIEGAKEVGSAVNKEKQTPLHLAAMEGFDDVVQVLLREGVCPPNAQDSQGWTALHVALVFEMDSTARILAQHTDILLRDSDGMTPVDLGLVVGTPCTPMSNPPSPFAI